MAHKHLHELLNEDQEPFYLNNYIADKRRQLKAPNHHTSLQLKKSKLIIETSTTRRSLFKQACSFSFHDSPDVRRSPFLGFPSPAKSPRKSPNTSSFLHIPARTAALLLEAAMKIQKQSSSSKSRPQIKFVGFGLFDSILKRLKEINRTKNREIAVNGVSVSVKDSCKLPENVLGADEESAYESGISCSANNSRLSSAGWSESNEEKSLDLETSISCRSEELEETEFAGEELRENGGFSSCERRFCSSPLSPFRFSLQRSPSYGPRTPDFLSPATSPRSHNNEEKENCEAESFQKIQLEEEEEEKEQCSPVSVLDPSFEEDEDDDNNDRNEGGYDYDVKCSYAIVQRTKQQLLHKLRRFERLAGLDPLELEKRMLEDQVDEDDNEDLVEEDECDDYHDESQSFYSEENVEEFVREVFSNSSSTYLRKIPRDMKWLLSDLIAEEKKNGSDESEVTMKMVRDRFDSWKEVESDTIDMMVELDFGRERDGWKRYDEEHMRETAIEIELGIFGLLVEELSKELVR